MNLAEQTACGDDDFISTCRKVTASRMEPFKPVRFTEVEYRPSRYRTLTSSEIAEEGRGERHSVEASVSSKIAEEGMGGKHSLEDKDESDPVDEKKRK